MRCLASDHLNGRSHQQHSNNLFGRRRECIIKHISSHGKENGVIFQTKPAMNSFWFAFLSLSYAWHANIGAVSWFHTAYITHVPTGVWVYSAFTMKLLSMLKDISMQSIWCSVDGSYAMHKGEGGSNLLLHKLSCTWWWDSFRKLTGNKYVEYFEKKFRFNFR